MIGEEFILLYVCYDKEDYLYAIPDQYLPLIGGKSRV